MDAKRTFLIYGLLGQIPEEERPVYRQIIDFITDLGYWPSKVKVEGYVVSFIHHQTKKAIAKIGVRKGEGQRAFLGLKFFGCDNIPKRYQEALLLDIQARKGQYTGPRRSAAQPNLCNACPSCAGGGIGYCYELGDGTKGLRCGAYFVPIPNITAGDIPELKAVMLAQHAYYQAIA